MRSILLFQFIAIVVALGIDRALHSQADALGIPTRVLPGWPQFIGFLLVFALVVRWKDRHQVREYGLRLDAQWFRHLLLGVAAGFIMGAWQLALLGGHGYLKPAEWFYVGDGDPSFAAGLLTVFASVSTAAIAEEVFSRAYPMTRLVQACEGRPSSREVFAIILAPALVFTLMHWKHSPLSLPVVAFAGVVFGCMYFATGQLAMPIGAHVALNFTTHGLIGGNKPTGTCFLRLDISEDWVLHPVAFLIWVLAPITVLAVTLWVLTRPGFGHPLYHPPKRALQTISELVEGESDGEAGFDRARAGLAEHEGRQG